MFKFTIENQSIEIVKEYCYLDILRSSSEIFPKGAENAIKEVNIAVTVRDIMTMSKLQRLDARIKISESTVNAILLYGIETWSMKHWTELQIIFSK